MNRVRQPRRPRDSAVRIGDFEVIKRGAIRFDWHDPYYFAVKLSWPQFIGLVIGAHLTLNVFFGAVYALAPGAVANARPGSFLDGFFFSIETLATVGYGVMAPQTLFGHLVSSAEIIVGMGFTAVTTGLLFVRFSRPRSPVLCANQVVVTPHNGCPTLMIRIANGRVSNLLNAEVRLNALVAEHTVEGHRFRRAAELLLDRSRSAVFPLTWTLMHRLDKASPLAGYDADRMQEEQVRLFLSIEAYDPVMAATVRDVKVYGHSDVAFGWRYADAVTTDASGVTVADLTRLHLIEPDPPSPGAASEVGSPEEEDIE